nr:zinc finger CCHC domain-containing protein 8-like [Ipomoea batatas]
MESEDIINLSTSSVSDIEDNEDYNCKPNWTPLPGEANSMDEGANGEIPENDGSEGDQLCLATNDGMDLDNSRSTFQDSVKLTETVVVAEKVTSFSSDVCGESGNASNIDHPKGYQQHDRSSKIDPSALSGVKRQRTTPGEEQPSVCVIYNNLTRESKHKLEELLQQWSQWSAEHGPSLLDEEVLESGEETYFPALRIGLDKPLAVSFWMDDLPRKKKNKDSTLFDANSVPLYDRGFSFTLSSTDGSSNLEGGLQVANASRCFNCGSYSHSLKDCPKPRDNVAVNTARKQHQLKRNKNAANPSRYYQSSQKGKYDGLKPGVLDPETRKLLGLGELDPPPWLHRMRKIGSPPRYLGPEDEDLPSGITIYGDDEIKEETEEGEILENSAMPTKAMSIEFPDKAAGPSSITASRTRSYSSRNKSNNHMSDTVYRGHYLEQHRSRDTNFEDKGPIRGRFSGLEGEGPPHRHFSGIEGEGPPHWHFSGFEGEGHPHRHFSGIEGEGPPHWRFRDFEGKCPPRSQFEFNNERPPGCELDPAINPLSYRYRDYDSINAPIDGLARSLPDRFRRSPLVDNRAFYHTSYPRY